MVADGRVMDGPKQIIHEMTTSKKERGKKKKEGACTDAQLSTVVSSCWKCKLLKFFFFSKVGFR